MKNYVFPFLMNMRKIHTVVRNGLERNLAIAQRENWKLISHSHAKCSRKAKLVLMHFPFRTIVRNCIFSRSLSEEASRRPLRWCQVSTWPWSINRNLIYSFEDFRHFLIVKFSRFPLYKILYFSSFSLIFSLAKHVLWD